MSCGRKHSCVRACTGRLGGVRVEEDQDITRDRVAVVGGESFTKKRPQEGGLDPDAIAR